MDIPSLVGTLAGDDTAFLAMRRASTPWNSAGNRGNAVMLKSLHIENIAVIERAMWNFPMG
jgi:hypothetical protein